MPNRIYSRLSQNCVSTLDFHIFHLAIFPDQYIEGDITLLLPIQCLRRILGPVLLLQVFGRSVRRQTYGLIKVYLGRI